MEIQDIIKKVKLLVADGDIKAALDVLYKYVSEHRKEFENECLMLKAQLSASQNKLMLGLVYTEASSVSFNSLTYGLLELLDKMEDVESQKKVEPVKSGRGLLMHNIPRLMPIDTKTRCTIRIGALKEELLKNFKTTADTAIEEIKVSKVMKVSMESMVGDIFEIHTVNSSEQYADLDTYSEWRYDVVPRQIGEFPLALVVATVHLVDARERVYEQVFEVTVNITTVENHLNESKIREWDSLMVVQNEAANSHSRKSLEELDELYTVKEEQIGEIIGGAEKRQNQKLDIRHILIDSEGHRYVDNLTKTNNDTTQKESSDGDGEGTLLRKFSKILRLLFPTELRDRAFPTGLDESNFIKKFVIVILIVVLISIILMFLR